jgi:hypothetical protein
MVDLQEEKPTNRCMSDGWLGLAIQESEAKASRIPWLYTAG